MAMTPVSLNVSKAELYLFLVLERKEMRERSNMNASMLFTSEQL